MDYRLSLNSAYLLVAEGSGSTRPPLRGNSSRGDPWVPGRGGSRTSSPDVPLGSSGSIGGCVCMRNSMMSGCYRVTTLALN